MYLTWCCSSSLYPYQCIMLYQCIIDTQKNETAKCKAKSKKVGKQRSEHYKAIKKKNDDTCQTKKGSDGSCDSDVK